MLLKGGDNRLVGYSVECFGDVKLDGDNSGRFLHLTQDFVENMDAVEATCFVHKTFLPGRKGRPLVYDTPEDPPQE
jgi:hypothetical protein